jgi:hypothetical protein
MRESPHQPGCRGILSIPRIIISRVGIMDRLGVLPKGSCEVVIHGTIGLTGVFVLVSFWHGGHSGMILRRRWEWSMVSVWCMVYGMWTVDWISTQVDA